MNTFDEIGCEETPEHQLLTMMEEMAMMPETFERLSSCCCAPLDGGMCSDCHEHAGLCFDHDFAKIMIDGVANYGCFTMLSADNVLTQCAAISLDAVSVRFAIGKYCRINGRPAFDCLHVFDDENKMNRVYSEMKAAESRYFAEFGTACE